MKPRQIDIHIAQIALGSRVAGGERILREALERELARFAADSYGQPAAPQSESRTSGSVPALARKVSVEIAREVER